MVSKSVFLSIHDISAFSSAPEGHKLGLKFTSFSALSVVELVHLYVDRSFGGFRAGRGETDNQLNIDGSTPKFGMWILCIDAIEDSDKP